MTNQTAARRIVLFNAACRKNCTVICLYLPSFLAFSIISAIRSNSSLVKRFDEIAKSARPPARVRRGRMCPPDASPPSASPCQVSLKARRRIQSFVLMFDVTFFFEHSKNAQQWNTWVGQPSPPGPRPRMTFPLIQNLHDLPLAAASSTLSHKRCCKSSNC